MDGRREKSRKFARVGEARFEKTSNGRCDRAEGVKALPVDQVRLVQLFGCRSERLRTSSR